MEEVKEVNETKEVNPKSRRKKIETREELPVQSEWKEQVIQIRRVTKVVKGGKKLSFRAIVVVGNQKGQVGVGCAKASEVIIAIQKAIDYLIERGYTEFTIGVENNNEIAKHIYFKNGFTEEIDKVLENKENLVRIIQSFGTNII